MSSEVQRARGRGRYGESRLAKRVHGVVVHKSSYVKLPSGRMVQIDVQHPPDVITEMFAFESKWIKSTPVMLQKVMSQAVRNAPQGFIPVGVIGDRIQGTVFYVLMERDFLDLHVGEKV
jgi:hypothetical protein